MTAADPITVLPNENFGAMPYTYCMFRIYGVYWYYSILPAILQEVTERVVLWPGDGFA